MARKVDWGIVGVNEREESANMGLQLNLNDWLMKIKTAILGYPENKSSKNIFSASKLLYHIPMDPAVPS